MQNQKVLLLDSDSNTRVALSRLLDSQSFHVIPVSSISELTTMISQVQDVKLLIGKQQLIDGKINQALRIVKKNNSELQSFVLMDNAEPTDLLSLKRDGVSDCFEAPFNLPEIVEKVVSGLQLPVTQTTAPGATSMNIYERFAFDDIIGRSPEITKVLQMVERVADSDSTILIMGESGTGKELIAKAIHYNSTRENQSLVPVNCGAIPGELLESELFGHIKGAFTGAINNRLGRFQMADNGSLFLDEIGDMPVTLQVKLLRVLQDSMVEPVGSQKYEKVNVRLIAATNVDLEKKVDEGKFREDLFYRLNVIPIRVPALRERRSDIPVLVQHFITKFNREKNRNITGVSPEAMDQLMKYGWPGNIRELENLMERMSVMLGEGIIQLADLPPRYLNQNTKTIQAENPSALLGEEGLDFNSVVDDFENRLILQALEKTGWNRNQAAKLLRLNRTTLVEKIKKKGLLEGEANA